MATVAFTAPVRPAKDQAVIVRAVTVIMGTVVGLTFTFGFGNVLTLAIGAERSRRLVALVRSEAQTQTG